MELKYNKRDLEGKKSAKRARRAGQIPAVVYGKRCEATTITIDQAEFAAHLRALPKEQLSTVIFDLKGDDNYRAIVKEVQYHPTTYDILHLDFTAIADDIPVNVKVPIRCTGVAECAGVKQGGVVRRVIRQLPVRCLPKHIPQEVIVDVTDLNLNQGRKLSSCVIPEGVRPLVKLEAVAVIVAKK